MFDQAKYFINLCIPSQKYLVQKVYVKYYWEISVLYIAYSLKTWMAIILVVPPCFAEIIDGPYKGCIFFIKMEKFGKPRNFVKHWTSDLLLFSKTEGKFNLLAFQRLRTRMTYVLFRISRLESDEEFRRFHLGWISSYTLSAKINRVVRELFLCIIVI